MDAPYTFLANYYDVLTPDVDYPRLASLFYKLMRKITPEGNLGLDLACGTGSLTVALTDLGLDMTGVDASPEMLSEAALKCSEKNILLLCQRMEELDLYGTVNCVFSCLDSINHLTETGALQEAFRRVGLFLEPGGAFIFDLITEARMHRLSGEACIRDEKNIFCAYRYYYEHSCKKLYTDLDLFSAGRNRLWARQSEQICERAWSLDEINTALEQAGMEQVGLYSDFTELPARPGDERIIVAAKKRR